MTDKVSTAPEVVERMAVVIEDQRFTTFYNKAEVAATLRALSAEVERLKVALAGHAIATAYRPGSEPPIPQSHSCYQCDTFDTIGADGSGHKDGCPLAGMPIAQH